MTEERIQYFTLEEANRTLPYVGPIVSDIVETYREWRAGVSEYETLAGRSRTDQGVSQEQDELRERVDEMARQINAYLEELSAVGCVFKGFDDGLVDFHSKLEGRDVFLCWKSGEPEITHWHELDAGFAGRQELVAELMEGEAK
jgi:hypothetical protein